MAIREKPFRLLALDISASPGFAVYEVRKGVPKLIFADSVKTSKDNTDAERWAYIESKTVQVTHELGPFDDVCREHFLKGGNKRGTQMVFGAWAATDIALARYGYAVPDENEIRGSRMRAFVGGKGNADKDDVEKGIRKLLGLPESYEFKSDDASDAAGIGYTYLYDKGYIKEWHNGRAEESK